jgi:hypothetical protein
MALTLTDLFEKQSESTFRNKVAAACWRHAKTLLAKPTPTSSDLKMASKLLAGMATPIYVIGVAVLIDDAEATDAAIETAVATVAGKLVDLEI